MRDMNRRLGKVERQLSMGEDKTVIQVVVQFTYHEGTAPDISEPYEEWITYKAALEKAVEQGEETGLEILLFVVDPFREYAVRNNLPEKMDLQPRVH